MLGWHIVVDDALAVGVAVVVDVEPSVAASAPAPVEVYHVVVVIAIKHVGMSTATMHHRPIHIDGIDNELHVILMGVILAIEVVHTVGVEEIGRHSLAQLARDRTAAGGTIVHVDRNARMINQLGNSLNLFDGRVGRDGIGHVFPVVSRLAEVDSQRTVFGMVFGDVGMATPPLNRVVPVLHQLGGSRCHAARIAMSARPACTFGAKIVVRIILVPSGRAEVFVLSPTVARHHAARFLQHRPVNRHFISLCAFLSLVHDELTFCLKEIDQSRCHIIGDKNALLGVADDGTHTVVAGHDDESRLAYVEDIIASLSPFGKRDFNQLQVSALAGELEVGRHKALRQITRSLLADGTGLQHEASQHQDSKGK